jgi:hypothetical protein
MADNPLTHKLGPLPLYQWLLIGGGLGAALYLYEKDHKSTAEEPKEELAGSTNNPFAGGGGSGEGGGASSLPGIAGPIGEPGPAGAAGAPGAQLTAGQEATLSAAAERLNNPPVGAETVAPQAKAVPSAKAKGEPKTTHEVNKNGEHFTVHTYADGKVEKFQTTAEQAADAVERAATKKAKTKAGDTGKISHAKKAPLKARHVPPPKPKKVAAKAKPAPKKKKR